MQELLNWIITNLEAFAENIVNAAMMIIVVVQSFSNKKNLKILKNNNKLDKQEIEKEEIKKLIKKGKKNMKKLTDEERRLLREILNEDETLKEEFKSGLVEVPTSKSMRLKIKDWENADEVLEATEKMVKQYTIDDFEKEDTKETKEIEETEIMVVKQMIAEIRELKRRYLKEKNILKKQLKIYEDKYEYPEDIKELIDNE